MIKDLALALRLLRKSPGFSVVAVLTLAVGIAANSAIVSLVDNVLFRRVVADRPEQVVCLYTASQDARRTFRQFSWAEFTALGASRDVFTGVAAVNFSLVSVGRDESFRRCLAFMVSQNYFEVMGVKPFAGRFFTPEESRPHAGQRVVVAGYSLWERDGKRPGLVGSTIRVNGIAHTIVGVAPDGFSGVSPLIAPELWLPFGLYSETTAGLEEVKARGDLTSPDTYTINVLGRMQPGIGIDAARARMPVLAARLNALLPTRASRRELVLARPFGLTPTPGDPGPLRLIGLLLLGMSCTVLLIASLNLANMMLARSAGRARGMAVRLAIGAGRWQIVRQVLVEGVVLAAIGGALGLVFSTWANVLLRNFFVTLLGGMGVNLTVDVKPDLPVIAATLFFCLTATLVSSLGPALKAARTDLVSDLKRKAGDAPRSGQWTTFFSGRHVMVMAQMALSLVLVFTACLFMRTASAASATEEGTGFRTRGVVVTELDFSLGGTGELEVMRRTLAAVDRVRALPGVQATSLTTLLPYANAIASARVVGAADADARRSGETAQGVRGIYSSVTDGYFATIGVRLLRGRDFTPHESREGGPPGVCIVDESMAKRLFPGRDAIGERVSLADGPANRASGNLEIVGIVGRHAHGMQDKGNPVPGIYVPFGQAFSPTMFLCVRSAGGDSGATQAAAMRKALGQLDPELPIVQMLPFGAFIEKNFTLWMLRLGAVMFGLFGGIALLLAGVGVYGVKAYVVTGRTREMGIRMALGAGRRDVFSLVMRQGTLQTSIGVGAGTALSMVAGRVLAGIFHEMRPLDLTALAWSVAILATATLAACVVPATRAAGVNPADAFRAE
jgi:predicted permease